MEDFTRWFVKEQKPTLANISEANYYENRDWVMDLFNKQADTLSNDDLKKIIRLESSMVERARKWEDDAYLERMKVVSFLSKIYPSCVATDEGGCDVVYIESPVGQLSWHIFTEDQKPLFKHLERVDHNPWDGHTTEDKYARMQAFGEVVEKEPTIADKIRNLLRQESPL